MQKWRNGKMEMTAEEENGVGGNRNWPKKGQKKMGKIGGFQRTKEGGRGE
jgi:hypothetical protein